MRVAMNEIYAYLKQAGKLDDVRMLLQVHDELVFEIKTEKVETELPKLKALMEGALRNSETYGVPLTAESKVGPNWGELEEVGK